MKKNKWIATVIAGFTTLLASTAAYADGAASDKALDNNKIFALAIALLLGVSVAAGAFSQARTASAALEGISRNPGAAKSISGSLILSLILIESLVIYALLISFVLYSKIV